MRDAELCEIFDALYRGGAFAGWRLEDVSDAQLLISNAGQIWARRIDGEGIAGAWVLLPGGANA